MQIILAAFIVILFAVIIIFAFPQFSPIPYYPSNMKDKTLILKALGLKNGQTIVDLGAGDGVVVFEAAKAALDRNLDTRFVALEINPVLLGIMHLRRLFHPNRKNIRIAGGDMFTADYRRWGTRGMTYYLYISPWLIEKVIARIREQVPGARFVSYFYPVKSLGYKEKKTAGVHGVYIYE